MLQTTQQCLAVNKPLFKDIPSFIRASAALDEIVTGILASQRQQADKEGLAQEKSAVRAGLAEAAHEIASLAHACAVEHGLDAIAKRTDLSLSDVQAGTEAQFIDRCKGILADAQELTDDLGDCGTTAAKVNALGKLIDSFEKVKPKPRRGVAVSSSATKRLPVLFRQAARLLRSRVDRLMVPFKSSQPDFYGEFKAARKIVNLSATHTSAKVKALKKPDASAPDKSKAA